MIKPGFYKSIAIVSATLLLSSMAIITVVAQASAVPYKNKNLPIEQRIEDLLKRMTLEEKILQTNQWTYGKNANENNIEASKKAVRPEIGSLIYRSINPIYRNDIMRKAMEGSRLGIPILM